jgi:hypothetical protein
MRSRESVMRAKCRAEVVSGGVDVYVPSRWVASVVGGDGTEKRLLLTPEEALQVVESLRDALIDDAVAKAAL